MLVRTPGVYEFHIKYKNWNKLLKLDKNNKLKERMTDVVDGDYQAYKGLEPKYMKQHLQ